MTVTEYSSLKEQLQAEQAQISARLEQIRHALDAISSNESANPAIRYADDATFGKALDRVLTNNAELFRKLAQ